MSVNLDCLDMVLDRLKYNRSSHVVELSTQDCKTMYDALLTVRRNMKKNAMPELRSVARGHLLAAQEQGRLYISRKDLTLLCDAVLALTEEV